VRSGIQLGEVQQRRSTTEGEAGSFLSGLNLLVRFQFRPGVSILLRLLGFMGRGILVSVCGENLDRGVNDARADGGVAGGGGN
jgi:hypothetical protein